MPLQNVLAQKTILLTVNKFLVWHKKFGFGLAQNILGPVKGRGISLCTVTFKEKVLTLAKSRGS